MLRRVRRLVNLYKLLWAEEQIAALEDQAIRLQDRMEKQRNTLQRQVFSLQQQIVDRNANLTEQLDALKSSLEVPQESIDEFFEWKARNPIPEEPLVSVTVATYNQARLLTERCIPSILNQTYENLELIVVGDGCTDGTEKAVSKIGDRRLKFYNLPERSVYPADPGRRWMVAGTPPTNEALSMSRGYFIAHLDHDDEYLPDRLEKLLNFATENDCDFVWHPFWWEDEEGRWQLWEAPDFSYRQVTNASVLYRSWFKRFESDINAHRLLEPGDWNRFRKIKYLDPVSMRYPEPLSRHYRERSRG
ncbi:MAG: glycosyltransferase [Rubrobacteraceae bacterium]